MKELSAALSKAQGQFTHAPKDSMNPHFKSNYADLASVWGAIRKPLTENGLAITQGLRNADGNQEMVTVLLHSSGESITTYYPIILPTEKMSNPQMLGAAVTYARRYALSAIVGIAQDDDDGNSVSVTLGGQSSGGGTKQIVNHAPGAINGSIPANTGTIASYRITFGKFKGKGFDEVGPHDIQNYCEYIERNAKTDGKPPKGNVKEFLDLAKEYVSGCGPAAPAFDSDEEIPF